MKKSVFSILCLSVFFLCSANACAFEWLKSESSDVKEGNVHLKKKENVKALGRYDEAVKALPNRGEVHLNRGLALSRLKEDKTDEAMQALTLAVDSDAPRPVLARAEFNLGNAFFKKEDYKAAIEHYKKSLILHPGNRDVAWNMEVARLKKKKQEEQQKKDQENQENQDQGEDGDSEQQENQDQEKKDQQSQDQEKQNKDGDPQQDEQQKKDEEKKKQEEEKKKQDEQKQEEEQKREEEKKEQEEQQQQEPQAAPPQNQSMERMLNALDKEDNDFHKNKAQQRAVGAPANVKDW